MPYILPSERTKFNKVITDAIEALEQNGKFKVGELNFLVSSIIWELFRRNKSYQTANDIVGVLECVKLEAYRRQFADYEKLKCSENGDL